ncbi:hypothetical protein VTI28DRAFT_2030 [Corynascus sepedonium]
MPNQAVLVNARQSWFSSFSSGHTIACRPLSLSWPELLGPRLLLPPTPNANICCGASNFGHSLSLWPGDRVWKAAISAYAVLAPQSLVACASVSQCLGPDRGRRACDSNTACMRTGSVLQPPRLLGLRVQKMRRRRSGRGWRIKSGTPPRSSGSVMPSPSLCSSKEKTV